VTAARTTSTTEAGSRRGRQIEKIATEIKDSTLESPVRAASCIGVAARRGAGGRRQGVTVLQLSDVYMTIFLDGTGRA
jgi:hypothetical protein